MSYRFRKSVKLAPGVRMNVGKRGLGLSAGPRGASYTVNTSGRKTASVGLPGTGVSYRSSLGASGSRSSRSAPQARVSAVAKPGLMAPRYEKEFFKGIQAYLAGDERGALTHLRAASEADDKDRSVADDFFAGLIAAQLGEDAVAIPHLEKVVASDHFLPDALMDKYVPGGEVEIKLAADIRASVPFGTVCALLVLAEAYQRQGRIDEAIGLLQQLAEITPESPVVLSLVEMLAEQKAWDEIVDVAAGITNEDDVTMAIRLYQAVALQWQQMDEAALEVYRDCLRSKKRDPGLLKWARYDRGKLYLRLGKTSQGRKDLGAVYADDPGYRDVRELLNAGARSTP
jgi:tetratricopeptide (TPR) repeat protein